jgi:hypothetical protein
MSEQDFTTPDRSTIKGLSSVAVTGIHTEEKKEDVLNNNRNTVDTSRPSAKLVTPPDSFSTAAAKEVRFDGKKSNGKNTSKIEAKTLCAVGSDEGDSSSTSSPNASQRGLVSRRGGRCGSPGRNILAPPSTGAKPSKEAADAAAAVLEFKTFRSPGRNGNSQHKQNENENSHGNDNTLPRGYDAKSSTTKVTSLQDHEQQTVNHHRRQQQSKQKPSKVASNNASVSSKKNSNVTFSPVPMPKIHGDKVSFLKWFFCLYCHPNFHFNR